MLLLVFTCFELWRGVPAQRAIRLVSYAFSGAPFPPNHRQFFRCYPFCYSFTRDCRGKLPGVGKKTKKLRHCRGAACIGMHVCFAWTIRLDQLCIGKDVWFSLGEGSLQRQCNHLQVPLVFFVLPIGYSWSPPFSASISLSGLLCVWPRSWGGWMCVNIIHMCKLYIRAVWRGRGSIKEPCNFHTGRRARVSAACMDARLSLPDVFRSFSAPFPPPFFSPRITNHTVIKICIYI